MSIDARVILETPKFRVIKAVEGEKVTYVFEKADGFDALGVQRWRELKFGEAEATSRMFRDYIIEQVREQEKNQ